MENEFNAYVDGFNLYKGALQGRPDLKWLDIRAFCQSRRPEMKLQNVYYFTADVMARFPGDTAQNRQHAYLRVLQDQGVEVVRGKFKKDVDWLRVRSVERREIIQPQLSKNLGFTQLALNKSARAAIPDLPRAQVWKFGEKGSDVNLASYLLRDVFKHQISAALVVSGDSDLMTPIKFAVAEGVNVKTLKPNAAHNAAALKSVSSHFEELHPAWLAKFQIPTNYVTSKGMVISRPKSWV